MPAFKHFITSLWQTKAMQLYAPATRFNLQACHCDTRA